MLTQVCILYYVVCTASNLLKNSQIKLMNIHEQHCFINCPDSIPSSNRRWLLVTWSADFANVDPKLAIGRIVSRFYQCWLNVGPTVACQPQLRLDISIFCQCWANGGFYSRCRQVIIGGVMLECDFHLSG